MPDQANMLPITEDWLRCNGFKYHDVDRSGRHWLLWIGSAIPDPLRIHTHDDFGIELVHNLSVPDAPWSLFFRADYAGRYSRFLFCRRIQWAEQLTRLIEAMIDDHMDACVTPYGFLATRDMVERLRKDDSRMDLQLAKWQEERRGVDPDKAVHT